MSCPTPSLSPAALRPWCTATLLGACALVLSACASSPPPPDAQMAVSKAAVERATNPAAADAPGDLAMATELLTRAQQAYAAKDYAAARQLAEQAEAQANLAASKARAARAARASTELGAGVQQLRDETLPK